MRMAARYLWPTLFVAFVVPAALAETLHATTNASSKTSPWERRFGQEDQLYCQAELLRAAEGLCKSLPSSERIKASLTDTNVQASGRRRLGVLVPFDVKHPEKAPRVANPTGQQRAVTNDLKSSYAKFDKVLRTQYCRQNKVGEALPPDRLLCTQGQHGASPATLRYADSKWAEGMARLMEKHHDDVTAQLYRRFSERLTQANEQISNHRTQALIEILTAAQNNLGKSGPGRKTALERFRSFVKAYREILERDMSAKPSSNKETAELRFGYDINEYDPVRFADE